MRALPDDALDAIESQVVRATVKEAVNPAHLAPGEIRPIEKRDALGNKRIDWIGQNSFVKAMGRAGRRVVSFTTDRGRYDAIKARFFELRLRLLWQPIARDGVQQHRRAPRSPGLAPAWGPGFLRFNVQLKAKSSVRIKTADGRTQPPDLVFPLPF